jgi:hypothetical protein
MDGSPDGKPLLPGSYSPAELVADVMTVVAQRGLRAHLRGDDVAQVHQAAWTLLTVLDIHPDTDRCPCLACRGTELALAEVVLLAPEDDGPGGAEGPS